MSPLERRCRALLRAYPRSYRRQRGDEMLATLLEASRPGQEWPSARDARALIMGGLRVRVTQDQRLTTAANLRLAAQLGFVLTLLVLVAGNLTSVVLIWAHIYGQSIGTGIWSVYGLLGLATVVAAWFAPRPVVAVLAAAAAVAAAWVYWGGEWTMAILPAALLVILAVLLFFGERMPRSWLWLAGAFFSANVLLALSPLLPLFLYNPLVVLFWIMLGSVAIWGFVDARPAMALAICLACTYVASQLLSYVGYGFGVSAQLFAPAIVAVLLAASSFWRLRRQAVL